MSDENLVMARDTWEAFREYRKVPFKKRYEELEKLMEEGEFLSNYL